MLQVVVKLFHEGDHENQSIGFCMIGNYVLKELTKAQIET